MIGEGDLKSVDIPYKFFSDKLNSELAVTNINGDFIKDMKIIPHFTGSFASLSPNINDDAEIIYKVEGNACEYSDVHDDGEIIVYDDDFDSY